MERVPVQGCRLLAAKCKDGFVPDKSIIELEVKVSEPSPAPLAAVVPSEAPPLSLYVPPASVIPAALLI